MAGYLDESTKPENSGLAGTAMYGSQKMFLCDFFVSVLHIIYPRLACIDPFFSLINYSSLMHYLKWISYYTENWDFVQFSLGQLLKLSMEENGAIIFCSDEMWLEIHAENIVIFINMNNARVNSNSCFRKALLLNTS